MPDSSRYVMLRQAIVTHNTIGSLLEEALEDELRRQLEKEHRDPQEVDREILGATAQLQLDVLRAFN